MVVTRERAIPVRRRVIVAEITRTIRGIDSEVTIGSKEGLPQECVINCDNLATVSQDSLEGKELGHLGLPKLIELDQALRFALGITF